MHPTYGLRCPSMIAARVALERCRFAYKAYAQTLRFPMDPFFESWGPGFSVSEQARDLPRPRLQPLRAEGG